VRSRSASPSLGAEAPAIGSLPLGLQQSKESPRSSETDMADALPDTSSHGNTMDVVLAETNPGGPGMTSRVVLNPSGDGTATDIESLPDQASPNRAEFDFHEAALNQDMQTATFTKNSTAASSTIPLELDATLHPGEVNDACRDSTASYTEQSPSANGHEALRAVHAAAARASLAAAVAKVEAFGARQRGKVGLLRELDASNPDQGSQAFAETSSELSPAAGTAASRPFSPASQTISPSSTFARSPQGTFKRAFTPAPRVPRSPGPAPSSPGMPVPRARAKVKKWVGELQRCLTEAEAAGQRTVSWSSGEVWGVGREASTELLKEMTKELEKLDLTSVEWWHGPGTGWTTDPGTCPIADGPWSSMLATRPIPVERRRFGTWGFAVQVRLRWDGVCQDALKAPCRVCQDKSHRRAMLEPCGHVLCRLCSRRSRGRPCLVCGAICTGIVDCTIPTSTTHVQQDEEPAAAPLVWGSSSGAYGLRPFAQKRPRSAPQKSRLLPEQAALAHWASLDRTQPRG